MKTYKVNLVITLVWEDAFSFFFFCGCMSTSISIVFALKRTNVFWRAGNGNHFFFFNKTKPTPVKRTWRRPWKKKKEREKRQPVKKARRLKRRRVVVPKKNVIHIDPRHGPPVSTTTIITTTL